MDVQLKSETVSEEKICQGYLQYRTGQFLLMFEEAGKRGIIAYLEKPRTFEQIAKNFGFVRALNGLQGVLDALIWFGVVQCSAADDLKDVFQLVEGYSLPEVDNELLRIGVGEKGIDSLKQIGAFSRIFSYMAGEDGGVQFDAENEELWEQFLEYPYYVFGRDRAVHYISYSGAKVLDFGAGLGHGTETIAELVGKNGRAVAIESSLDFVVSARKRLASITQAEVKHLDMQTDLVSELGENTFDGAMFIGAFHYVKDKLACLKNLSNIIRPGGKLVIGNTCTQNGALDEGMLTFGTAMITPPAYSVSPEELYEYFSTTGFEMEHKYFFGCQGWFFLTLREN
jgi:ubiquinone/menaquinone biosynthesis C-methylase UbiE